VASKQALQDKLIASEEEFEKLQRRQTLFEATEQFANVGHYEWNYELDQLESCSEEYAKIFNMTISEALAAHSSWASTLGQIHPEDLEHYRESSEELRDTKSLDVKYRVVLANGVIKHLHEIGVVVTDQDGSERGTFGIIQDISSQVKYDRDLHYRDALAEQTELITDIGQFIYDELNEKYLYVSKGFARIYETDSATYMKKFQSVEDDLSDVHPEDRDRVAKEYLHYISSRDNIAVEYRIIREDGNVRWIREMAKAQIINNGNVVQTVGVIQDITNRVNREQELLFVDAMASQAESIADIGYFLFDEQQNKHLYCSLGQAKILGLDLEYFTEKIRSNEDYIALVYADDQQKVHEAFYQELNTLGRFEVEYRIQRPDGQIRWIREYGKAHKWNADGIEQSIGVIQDITRQKNAEQEILAIRLNLEQQVVERTRELANTVNQLREEISEREKIATELDFLANHDALTGLPSLRLCKDRLDRSLADSRRNQQTSAVMFMDLDGFKAVNDSHGHEMGDRVLRSIAQKIQTEIRETDTVARIGGDEFVIILSRVPDMDIISRIASNLVFQISQPILLDNVEITIGSSIGIALYPQDGRGTEELIRKADKAMYVVKHNGKNNYGFVKHDQNIQQS
jgi:diguanylate cyclase (GGDEF)-like protein/PAS domain S-box-containing protein